MSHQLRVAIIGLGALLCLSCSHAPDPKTLVMIIESSPANLDPRVGTDGQSERIDMLLFDSLLRRDEHFNLQPGLAQSWETPDPLTYIFHLHSGVRFHDGHALTSRDVKWTIDSMLTGLVRSSKTSTYQYIQTIETPDDRTVIFHLKEPYASLPWNLSDGAIGIVPYGSGTDFNRHPVGSGPFRYVSAALDKEAVIERNPDYWDKQRIPHLARVRFAVVPDATTRVLELRKGSADIVSNALPADMVFALQRESSLQIEQAPGSIYNYLAFNLRDPILKDVRVRRAIAYAMDRGPVIHFLWRDQARPADSILPPQSWAFSDAVEHYSHDPARANALLDQAGYRADPSGIRFHLTMKTSTEEAPRLMAAVLQQQLRAVGIALDIRTFEFATFYSDIVKGAFQLYSLRWIGGNQDPDIFEAVFDSASFPPRRYNRSFYSNPQVDSLIAHARRSTDQQERARDYAEIQKILSEDLPNIGILYLDNVLVHTRRVHNLPLSPSGDYNFLINAQIVN